MRTSTVSQVKERRAANEGRERMREREVGEGERGGNRGLETQVKRKSNTYVGDGGQKENIKGRKGE